MRIFSGFAIIFSLLAHSFSLVVCEQEESEEETLPDELMGFRRVLAGIYSHTSAHVVAAPMAHHIAIEGSRFRFSHDVCWLPVEGVLSMVEGSNMIMRFRNIKGKQVTYHNAMNYIYRPTLMEDMCLYEFFQKLHVVSIARAGDSEVFEFLEEHPCSEVEGVFYLEREALPVFPWNWLGSRGALGRAPPYGR